MTDAAEAALCERIAMHGRSLYERGLVTGSSGNISARSGAFMLLTPTNSCLGRLDPERISKVSMEGELASGDKPTKEVYLHKAVYEVRPEARAVVHLHSTYAVAVSCLGGLDENNVLPPLTPRQVVHVGELPLVPYHRPGARELAEAVRERAASHHAVLLAHHGPVVSSSSLDAAVYAAEELEEAAKMFLIAKGMDAHALSRESVEELHSSRGS